MRTSQRGIVAHCVIGPGRLGSALLAALNASGQSVVAVGVRCAGSEDRATSPPFLDSTSAVAATLATGAATKVLWLTVPDDAIAAVAGQTATMASQSRGHVAVVHCSGLCDLNTLEPWQRVGAEVLSLHPLQTFAGGEGEAQRLNGIPIAVTAVSTTARQLGEQLVNIIGGQAFLVPESAKPLYHLAATVASNLFVALQSQASELLRQAVNSADLEQAVQLLSPLLTTSLRNIVERGPQAALTGPVARGDVGTVRAHLSLLERQPARVQLTYRALSLQALSLAAPRLDNEAVQTLRHILDSSPDHLTAPGPEIT